MIIKRWTGAWTEQYPKTTTPRIFTANGLNQIFSGDKILPAYLPDSVFDTLKFYGVTGCNMDDNSAQDEARRKVLAEALIAAKNAAVATGNIQNVKGYYWVINDVTGSGVIQDITAIPGATTTGEFVTLGFRPQDGGSSSSINSSSGTLEVGDWFVIESISGSGSSGSPWTFTASVINNTYESATTSVAGIVTRSSSTSVLTTGNAVITDGILNGLMGNAATQIAYGNHGHGNITTGGLISAAVVTPADTDTILISDATASGKIERGITIGTSTTTFLTNAGTWATPTGTYTHPNHSGDVTSVGDGATTIAANAVTNAKFRQSGANSVVGRSTNTSGDVADIAASTDGHVLRLSGTALGFGTVATAGIGDDQVTFAKIQNSAVAGLSVVGRSVNSAGDFAEIAAGTDGHVLTRVNATSLAFGQVQTAGIADNAVTNAKFRQGAALSVVGVTGSATANVADIAAGTDHHVLRRSGTSLGFGLLTGNNLNTNTVGNSNLVNMNQNTIKGRITASTGAPEDLTASNVRSIIELAAPIYVQIATPTTSVTHALWYDIN